MGRVAGSYESVVGGVSEQVPESRRSGQVTAQVNIIGDPVRGNARRHGSVLQDEAIVAADWETLEGETATSVAVPFYVGGTPYDLILRKGAGSMNTLAFCFNKQTRTTVPVVTDGSDHVLTLMEGGASAWVNVGRYMYIAGNLAVPTATSVNTWGAASNKRLLAGWIRGGAYARTFVVTLTKADGTTISASYKTDYSAYQGVLDTSSLDPNDANYQANYNNMLNAYNSAVTAWIGTAAESTTPANIATKLVAALIVAGVSSSDVYATNGYIVVDSTVYTEIALDDSGDGSLVRSVGNVIQTVDAVSSRHFVGKVVKVQPDTDKSAFPAYLKAAAKDGVSTGFTEVVWEEASGFEWTPTFVFCMGTVEGGTFYLAGSASSLETLTGIAEVPDYVKSAVGDDLSAPLPDFFGKTITCMFMFQDRLGIVAGSTVLMSRNGDYLNWFRKSVLSVQDDDPWQGYALGAEDDTIRHWELFDRSLYLFGDRFQYAISGKQTFTASNGSVPIATKYKDATEAAPKSNGNYVFYCKHSGVTGTETTSLHQVQPGIVSDVAETYPTSQALDKFLAGRPVELLPMSAPNIVFLRTTGYRNRLYTYGYIDDPNSATRKWDSWAYWEWDARVGSIVGMSDHGSDILVYMVKQGVKPNGEAACWFSCEVFVRDTTLSGLPYMDSLRPYSSFTAPVSTSSVSEAVDMTGMAVAVQKGHERQLLGTALADRDALLSSYPAVAPYSWVGYHYDAYFTPTNPFARDSKGVAIVGGRLTLGSVLVTIADSGGVICSVTYAGNTEDTLTFTGRILGSSANLVGQQPIVTTSLSAYIGREVRECEYTLKAVKWLPFTVTGIEWSGQFFYNTRRV